jgi:hypothetical protein
LGLGSFRRRWETGVGSGKWEVGRRKLEVGSGKLEVGRRKLEVGRRKWGVGSGKTEVGSTKGEDENAKLDSIFMCSFGEDGILYTEQKNPISNIQ